MTSRAAIVGLIASGLVVSSVVTAPRLERRTPSETTAASTLTLLAQDQRRYRAPKCFRRIVNLQGATRGDDFLLGRIGRDVVHGKKGSDDIFGLSGSDRLCGGRGEDRIDGGEGFDRIDGGPGYDVCSDSANTRTRRCEQFMTAVRR